MAPYLISDLGTARTCDHGDCPALAVHVFDLFDQDFYFCNHHALELHLDVAPTPLVAATTAAAIQN
jgi:hypothetical protein